MKKLILNLAKISTIIILASCVHPDEMLTRVNEDGSCYREFSAIGDSAFMVGDTAKSKPFPVQLDSSWKILWNYVTPEIHYNWPLKEWKNDTTQKKAVIYVVAHKSYSNVKELASSFKFNNNVWDDIHPKILFYKKNRWFYTYNYYIEIFPKIKTFDKVPITKYLNPGEIKLYFQGNEDMLKGLNGIEIQDMLKNIEKKKDEWFFRNLFEENYQVILRNIYKIKDKSIDSSKLIAAKEKIFKIYKDSDFKSNDELYTKLDRYFKISSFTELCEKNNQVNEELKKDPKFLKYFKMEINYKLMMPGKIIHSNTYTLKGDTLFWKVDAYRFAFNNYVISAESRVSNIWAFIISGIIILLAFGSFFYKREKKSHS